MGWIRTFFRTALPLPFVVRVSAKLAKTNQVDASTAFVIELARPFIANLVQRVNTLIFCM